MRGVISYGGKIQNISDASFSTTVAISARLEAIVRPNKISLVLGLAVLKVNPNMTG